MEQLISEHSSQTLSLTLYKTYINCFLEEKLVHLLRSVAIKSGNNFAGLGIVVLQSYAENDRFVDMRPRSSVTSGVNAFSVEGENFFVRVARKNSTEHDGFCIVRENGCVLKTSQFLFPPYRSDMTPDITRGARSYSSLCGSLIRGVYCIGIASSDGRIAVYQQGKCVYDSIDGVF